MTIVLLATRNNGKIHEFKTFLSDLPIKIVSLDDLHLGDDIEEDGRTYKENSQKKAIFFAKKSKLPAIADDGGIEIDALHGKPGIKSRRWLGYEATDEELITYMTNIATNLPNNNRGAEFKTVVSFALPNGEVWSKTGTVQGIIAAKPHLKTLQGYPYRSFFYLPKIKKFYFEAELTNDEQKLYNHRYNAVQNLKPIIKKALRMKD